MEALAALGASALAEAVTSYGDALRTHQQAINRLNVYPVPDGDTGTNMALTVQSVVTEIDELGAGPHDMVATCRAINHGSLMGARGNSGVILSQLLRGLTAELMQRSDGDSGADIEAGPSQVAAALMAAADAARQAVLRPVKGTILTVADAAGEGALVAAAAGAGLIGVLESSRACAAEALARTPEQLAVLAQAGVVDAGGTGYVLFIDALLHVADGRPMPDAPEEGPDVADAAARVPHAVQGAEGDDGGEGGEPSLRYEVMYLLEARDETIPAFKDVWAGIGDSIVVVGGEGLWNCHIHTNDVGPSIEAALDAGRPRNIRVTDLIEQMQEERWVREAALAPPGADGAAGPVARTAVVAVANGEGVGRIFRSLGVHHLVSGGQSMNPSTAQILEVVDAVPSQEVVLLPNNDNILPVALQVCELSNKTVRVVPTSGIVEGFAALLEFDPEEPVDVNAKSMAESARRVVAGEVTRAVRDATGPVGPIRAGAFLGLSRDGIEAVGETLAEATCGLLAKLLTSDHELVTLIEGEGAGTADTRQVTEWLAEQRPELAVEVHHGGQPLYPYLVSIE